ncbi:MAG TPA: helix-turn-helix transcriptional regulator [Oleiagrimonas sp.]|nr:helix-turn-helix transcriptional regulator [Oleiagrimonas sp.]
MYKEPGTSALHRSATAIPMPGFGRRIGMAAKRIGTRRYASDVTHISPAALQRYIKEENAPSFDVAARLCAAAEVRLDWLATGEGPMTSADASTSAVDGKSPSARLEETKLTEALATIDQALTMTQRRTTPLIRARLAVMAYRILTEEASAATILSRIMQAVEDATSVGDA